MGKIYITEHIPLATQALASIMLQPTSSFVLAPRDYSPNPINNEYAKSLNIAVNTSSNTAEALQSVINPIIDNNRVIIFADHSHRSPLMHCTLALIEDRLLKDPAERIAICPEALFTGVPVAQNASYGAKLYRQLAIKHPKLEFYGLETSLCEERQNRINLLSNYASDAIEAGNTNVVKKCSAEIFGYIEESCFHCPDFRGYLDTYGFKNAEIHSADTVHQLISDSNKETAQYWLEKLITIASIYSSDLMVGAEANRLDTNGDFARVIPLQDHGINKIIVIAGENHCFETDQSRSIQQYIEGSPDGRNEKVATILFNGESQFAYGHIQDPELPHVKSVAEHLTFPGQLVMYTMRDSPKMQEYAAMLRNDEPTPEPIFKFSQVEQKNPEKCTLF